MVFARREIGETVENLKMDATRSSETTIGSRKEAAFPSETSVDFQRTTRRLASS
jgi:hypothetical protein